MQRSALLPWPRRESCSKLANGLHIAEKETATKQRVYTAVLKQRDDVWIGWIEEIPGVNCQEATRSELLETLQVTLAEALELNRAEAREAAGTGFEELSIAV